MSHHLDTNTIYTFATFFSDMFLCVCRGGSERKRGKKGGTEGERHFFFFPVTSSTIYFEMVSGLQKICKSSVKNSSILFTQIP